MSIIYYTGVIPGTTAGHYCVYPGYEPCRQSAARTPWGDGAYPLSDDRLRYHDVWPELFRLRHGRIEYTGSRLEPEGIARHARRDGWTLLMCWDRSADPRRGSIAAFAINETIDAAEMEARMRDAFPHVFARIERHLGATLKIEGAP